MNTSTDTSPYPKPTVLRWKGKGDEDGETTQEWFDRITQNVEEDE